MYPHMSTLSKIENFLFKPVSASTLVVFRFFFGSIMLWEVFRYWPRIKRYYIDPDFLFKYDFFHWVKALPGDWIYAHFVLTGIAAACVALGLFYRVAATFLFLGFSYIFLLEQANYLNHIYFVNLVAFLMIFVNANCCYSLDSLFVPSIRSSIVPRWNVAILQFQIGAVYFFGGVAKINWDWISGEPLRNWLAKRGDYEYIGPYLTQWWSPYFFSWSGLLLDLFVPFLLLWKRTRLLAVAGVLTFHLLNSQIFTIGIFPWMMLAATLIFFEPDALKKYLPKWPGTAQVLPSPSSLVTFSLGIYCLI